MFACLYFYIYDTPNICSQEEGGGGEVWVLFLCYSVIVSVGRERDEAVLLPKDENMNMGMKVDMKTKMGR